jgi:uncharacterized membrane protein YgcG
MARDYVSIREEIVGGQTIWTFSSVTHERRKSAPAKVTRLGNRYAVMGAVWGAAIEKVEVQGDAGRGRRRGSSASGPSASAREPGSSSGGSGR